MPGNPSSGGAVERVIWCLRSVRVIFFSYSCGPASTRISDGYGNCDRILDQVSVPGQADILSYGGRFVAKSDFSRWFLARHALKCIDGEAERQRELARNDS